MKKHTTLLARGISLALLTGLAAPASAAAGQPWDWMIAPYIWNASTSMDLAIGSPPTPVSSDSVFANALDEIDGIAEVHIEGRGDHFGVMADFTYFGLASESDFRVLRTETDMDTRLFDAGVTWSPGTDRARGLDLIGGLRYIDADYTTRFVPYNAAFSPASVKLDQTYTDVLLGARYTWALSDRWLLTARGDGSFGDSDGTWGASLNAQFLTKHGAWQFGYRYLSLNVEANRVSTELVMSGPIIGYGFKF